MRANGSPHGCNHDQCLDDSSQLSPLRYMLSAQARFPNLGHASTSIAATRLKKARRCNGKSGDLAASTRIRARSTAQRDLGLITGDRCKASISIKGHDIVETHQDGYVSGPSYDTRRVLFDAARTGIAKSTHVLTALSMPDGPEHIHRCVHGPAAVKIEYSVGCPSHGLHSPSPRLPVSRCIR